MSQIENGKRPYINTLKRISRALKVPGSLIYVVALEKEDIPKNKALLCDKLLPVIKILVMQITVEIFIQKL